MMHLKVSKMTKHISSDEQRTPLLIHRDTS